MTPENVSEFVGGLHLPDGWGILCREEGGEQRIVISEASPDLWLLWIAKRIVGGRILKGGVSFRPEDTPREVEARAWVALRELRIRELRDAAEWN